ncbi:MAG TPA: hypothetical protein VGD12_08065, partial [Blastococcus sp.]
MTTDLSQHPTADGKLFCCTIKDLFSNRTVGYAIDDRTTAQLAVTALRAPVARRQPALALAPRLVLWSVPLPRVARLPGAVAVHHAEDTAQAVYERGGGGVGGLGGVEQLQGVVHALAQRVP